MSANTEKCGDNDQSVCDYNEFRRLRFFNGMLLADKDFRAEQEYHAGKRRLLNRMLHGSGVVCGLDVSGKKDSQWIEITSGLALDCSGNEIWIPKTQRVDLTSLLPPKKKPRGEPECRPENEKDELKTYYIGIRYEEKSTNPVSVYLPSGSCEETTCENSQYKEGFCIEIVECCLEKPSPGLIKALCDCETGDQPQPREAGCGECGPPPPKPGPEQSGQQATQAAKDWCKCVRLEEFCEKSVPCPECCSCEKPCYVILGQIKVNDKYRVQSVCINECRRYVLTGRLLQSLALGVFAGSEEYYYVEAKGTKVFIPNVGELVQNPIKALCWYLKYKLIGGGKIEKLRCDKKEEKGENLLNTMLLLRSELASVSEFQLKTAATIRDLSEKNRMHEEQLEAIRKHVPLDQEGQPPAKSPKGPTK